jgi:MFS family permease
VIPIRRFFHNPNVPAEHRNNFLHLYFDIGWFGVLSGSTINFLNIYAARIGATGFQIGMLGAIPALTSLLIAIPVGNWLEKRPINRAVFIAAFLYRFGFLFYIFLPWLNNPQQQIWAMIALSFLMSIPLTAVGVGFNALFATAVPINWRASVAGIRNAGMAVTFMLTSLVCGYLLNRIAFPTGYQIVFTIGFIGAMMTTAHLSLIRLPEKPVSSLPQLAQRRSWGELLRLDIWNTPFRVTLLVLLGFHLAQYLAIPLFPIYFVKNLHLTDQQIGIGTAMFYLTMLIGSIQLARFSRRFGDKTITGIGVILLSLYPILLTFSHNFSLFLLTSAIGGFAWALIAGALPNHLLSRVPDNDRPSYLAWYNIILSAAILFGSLAGPIISNQVSIGVALILFGVLRLFSGIVILKWGG